MQVYILCPDGKNRPEFYILRTGYLIFGEMGVNFYEATYVKMGNTPVNVRITDNPQYKLLDIADERPVHLIINKVKERNSLLYDLTMLDAECAKLRKASSLKRPAADEQLAAELSGTKAVLEEKKFSIKKTLENLERDLLEPVNELREATGTVGRI